jgi:hypothetical protein
MKTRWIVFCTLALTGVGVLAADTQVALLTVDQAFGVSQRTGRPIFAVAGSAT